MGWLVGDWCVREWSEAWVGAGDCAVGEAAHWGAADDDGWMADVGLIEAWDVDGELSGAKTEDGG